MSYTTPLNLMPKPQADRVPETIVGNVVLPPKRKPQRRTLSCLPCREHKVKCNRSLPCGNCIRNSREDLCRRFPALTKAATRLANPGVSRPPPTRRQHGLAREPGAIASELVVSVNPSNSISSQPEQAPVSIPCPARDHVSRPLAEVGSSDNIIPSGGSISRNVGTSAHPVSVRGYTSFQATRPTNQTCTACEEDAATIQQSAEAAHMPGSSSPLDCTCNTPCMLHMSSLYGSRHWRCRLIRELPTQSQCDVLVSFFLENINYIYQAVHVPTFRQACATFWADSIDEISLIWLSLLYAIISVSALYLPKDLAELIGFDGAKMSQLSKLWYAASRHCLFAGGAESRPNLLQLQTFLTLQSYWLSMEEVETLNSCLGQAVRAAQSLGLDMDTSTATSVESEMRHRIWWELCTTDTFQSICLNRTPLIQSRLSKVPLPANCYDIDMSPKKIASRASIDPTEASFNILRAEATQILNRLFSEPGAAQPSYESAKAIDTDLLALTSRFSWYRQLCSGSVEQNQFFATLPRALSALPWQCHLFHTFLCVQRIRLYRPFLKSGDASARRAALDAAIDAFAVYRTIRAHHAENLAPIRHRFAMHTYQLFSTAISLVLLLVKEMPPDPIASRIRADVEMVATDLEYLEERRLSVPLAVHGSRILRHVLALHDSRCSVDDLVQVSLIPSVYSVIGGEDRTRQYLERPRDDPSSLNADPGDEDSDRGNGGLNLLDNPEIWNMSASAFLEGVGVDGLWHPIDVNFWEQFE